MVVTSSLAERLGHGPEARLAVIACRGLGSSHAANVGVYDALRAGLATSARLMVPCPWAREAASRYRGEDVGVELTLNAEHELYRWGPITYAPTLLDGNGGFPMSVVDLWDHAEHDEVRRECRSQLERAIYWGFDVSHLDGHLDALAMRPELFDVYLDLAVEFSLPLRLPAVEAERRAGFPFRNLAREEGIVFADHVIDVAASSVLSLERALVDLMPGVTEICLTPAVDTPELRSLSPRWAEHVEHHAALTGDTSVRAMVERSGATLIGYRTLRALQRATPRPNFD